MIGFIVRDQKETDHAGILTRGETVLFLATNIDVYRHCLKQSKPAVLLGEEPLASRHRQINEWAFEAMFALLEKYRTDQKKSLYLNSFFYDLRSCLLFSLKFLLVIETIVRDKKIKELRLFDRRDSLLEAALKAAFHKKGSSVKLQIEKEIEKPKPRNKPGLLREIALFFLTIYTNRLASFLIRSWKLNRKKFILASGSPRHLGDTLCRLKTVGCEILHVETNFNFEQFLFAAKNGLAYQVIPSRSVPANPFQSDPPFNGPEKISFEERDFSEYFNAIFASFKSIGLINFSFDARQLHDLFSDGGIGAVLLDEEFAQRRQIAVQAQQLGIPAFVVSHGIPASAFLDPDEPPRKNRDLHNPAEIFVSSEFEKRAYVQIFYSTSKIHAIGVPRYDLLKRQLKEIEPAALSPSKKKKILYCSSGFIPYDFEFLSVVNTHLGVAANVSREAEEIILKAVFRTASQNPETVVQIKSKYGDSGELRNFIKENAGQACVEILPSDANFFELKKNADVIVTAPSSVICEALMHRKPVIVFNRSYALMTEPYQKRGVAMVVSNQDEFGSALTRCLTDSKFVVEMTAAQSVHEEYFAGRFDGGSAARIADRILDVLRADRGASKKIS